MDHIDRMFTVCQELSKLFTFTNTFPPQNQPNQTSALTTHTAGITNLPKRHREGPNFHSHEKAEFGFKPWQSGPESMQWTTTF